MNILLTSAGRRTYLINYFKEALNGIGGEIHASNSIETYSIKQADKYVVSPMIYDNNYIPFLLNYCLKWSIKAVIPLLDIDLLILSKNKQLFKKNGIEVIVADENVIHICNDKWLTFEFLIQNNIPTPKTFISIDSFVENYNKYPVIVKPRWGMASIGIYEAINYEELCVFFNKTIRDIKNSYLKYESQADIEKSVIIQEKLIGEEFGVEVLNSLNSEYLTSISKKKLAMRAGETDSAQIVYSDELYKLSLILSQRLKHIGNLDVDCFFSNNKFHVIELNCRFGGQYPFSHLAGVNFPKVFIDLLKGNTPNQNDLKPRINTIGYKDLVPVLKYE